MYVPVRWQPHHSFYQQNGAGKGVDRTEQITYTRREAEELYRSFGKAWAKFPETWKLYLLSSHTEFERIFGKTADRKRKLYNGMLKCDLFLYGVK